MPRDEDGRHTDRRYRVITGGDINTWIIVEIESMCGGMLRIIGGFSNKDIADRMCDLANEFGLFPGDFLDK